MALFILLIVMAMAASGDTVNRPVYKIALTQKGFAQFLQYDVETPPLREFTFCTWIRVLDLEDDQSIFTYIVNGNNRVVRLWLDSGGQQMKVSFDEKFTSSAPVSIMKDAWRHVCLSYQSDHGAWALYIDAKLVSCEAAQSLSGLVLPGRGSIIIGYGVADNGASNGFEGEIFGTNMILKSTIERNYTMKNNPRYKQKTFEQNKLMGNNDINYVILGNVQSDLDSSFGTTELPPSFKSTSNFVRFKTPHSIIEHDVGISLAQKGQIINEESSEKEILDFPSSNIISTTQTIDRTKESICNLERGTSSRRKFQAHRNIYPEQSSSYTHGLPTVSEYETPPPVGPSQDYSSNINPKFKSFLESTNNSLLDNNRNTDKEMKVTLSDIETPPPLETNNPVYGQWTSSKFAASVLNYLRRINLNNREQKKTPPTIPLFKISDTFPYASEFKVTKTRPPYKFQRRSFIDKYMGVANRVFTQPQINVKILKNDLRNQILESHAQTQPQNVEIFNRGLPKRLNDRRFYRQVDDYVSSDEFITNDLKTPHKNIPPWDKSNSLISILPFLKSVEYFEESNDSNKITNSNGMYLKSLSNVNKWHNIKSYNNDYTPRQINSGIGSFSSKNDQSENLDSKHPSVRLKYRPDVKKIVINVEEPAILEGRALATEISNDSNKNLNNFSILKYNHGFLPSQQNNRSRNIKSLNNQELTNRKNSFNRHIKIGNALNERQIIGYNEKQNDKIFVGGDERVPDINRYRSDIDHTPQKVPPSLGPRICKNVATLDHSLFIQPDESIDISHIFSPFKEKNIGMEFVQQNYKKCSLEDSTLAKSPLLFINWSKTPVRLFGGAYPKKTTDLCGFF